ncbi:MAG: succinylglutamate desuccinylase/aspartoacylase family protein, partial [Phycisphaerae bacterium]
MESIRTPGVNIERIVAHLRGTRPGPMVICVSSLHGNEPAGEIAFQRVAATLEQNQIELRGDVVGVRGNLAAIAAGVRFVDRDLNRLWTEENVARVQQADPQTLDTESLELRALLAMFIQLEAGARGPLIALDFHTTSAPSAPFCVVSDTLANRG